MLRMEFKLCVHVFIKCTNGSTTETSQHHIFQRDVNVSLITDRTRSGIWTSGSRFYPSTQRCKASVIHVQA